MNTEANMVPPPPSDPPKWFGDYKAKAEEENWDKEGKLRGQEEKNHLLWLKTYGVVVLFFMVFFSLLFIGSLGAWAFHYLMPSTWHWLDDIQLSKIQSVIFSGSLGGIISYVAQKQISK